MEGEFVKDKEARELKKLGLDKPCCKYIYLGDTAKNVDVYGYVLPDKAKNFNEDSLCISVPTYSQAFKWFRDEFGIEATIVVRRHTPRLHYQYHIEDIPNKYGYSGGMSFTYEDGELEILKKLIEVVKSHNYVGNKDKEI